MARRRYQDGSGSIGFGGLFGTSFGYVGTSIYFVLGGIGLYALGVTPLLILIVGVVFVATAWSYAEGSAAMPESSGVTSFTRRAFGPLAGFAAAWALLLDSIVLVAIVCSFIPSYLSVFWPQLQDWPYDFLTSLAVLVVIVALNLLGAHESVRLNALMALLGVATLVFLVIVGFLVAVKPGLLWSQIALGTAPTWRSLLYAVPLAVAAFIGLDAVSSRAETALRPARDVPRAINLVLPLIVALAVGLAVVALSALPVGANVVPVDTATGLTRPVPVVPGDEPGVFVLADDPSTQVLVPVEQSGPGHVIPAQEPTGAVTASPDGPVTRLYGTLLGSAYLQDPVMGLVASLPESLSGLEDVLRVWLAVIVAVSLLLAANAVVGGSARVVFSLARHHQVPAALGRVHATRMTPYVGIVLFGVGDRRAADPQRPAPAARAVRVRRRARVHGRERLHRGAALPGALHLAAVRDPLQRPLPRRPAADPGRRRGGGHGRGLGAHGGHPRRRRRGRLRLARRRSRAVRGVPAQQGLRAAHPAPRGGGAGRGPLGRRLRPHPRARGRHAAQRRDDGPRLPARGGEGRRHRRPLRARGADEPAAGRVAAGGPAARQARARHGDGRRARVRRRGVAAPGQRPLPRSCDRRHGAGVGRRRHHHGRRPQAPGRTAGSSATPSRTSCARRARKCCSTSSPRTTPCRGPPPSTTPSRRPRGGARAVAGRHGG